MNKVRFKEDCKVATDANTDAYNGGDYNDTKALVDLTVETIRTSFTTLTCTLLFFQNKKVTQRVATSQIL